MSTLTPGNNPYALFTGLDGRPLNGGKVYIGVAGQDPETDPQPIFWDADGNVPATNPMETQAGYIWNSGTPARFWTQDNAYSIRVRDRLGRQVFYAANVTFELPQGSVVAGALPAADSDRAAFYDALRFLQTGGGAVYRPALEKAREVVSIDDFAGDTDAARLSAAKSAHNRVVLPGAAYQVDETITFTEGRKALLGYGSTISTSLEEEPLFNFSQGADYRMEDFNVSGPGKGVGNAALINFPGTLNVNRVSMDNVRLENGHTGLRTSAGWGHHINGLYVRNMSVGVENVESPILGGWGGSGYVMTNLYIGACDVGLRDNALWNATYINPIIENCVDPYIQNTQGTATVMISPWFEDNDNAPQWRRGSVIIGGRFDNFNSFFADVQLTSARLQDAITYLGRDGIHVFRDGSNIHFRARGHGVDRFTGKLDALGFSAYHDSETTSKGLHVREREGEAGRWGVFGIKAAATDDVSNNVGLVLNNFSGYFGASVTQALAANAPNSQVRLTAVRSSANGGSAIGAIQFLTTTTVHGTGNTNTLVGRVEVYQQSFRPMVDGSVNLGDASLRWSTVYAGSGTINTSDGTMKSGFRPIDDDLIDAFLAIEPQLYQWNDAIEIKGRDMARWHMGFVAQHLESSLRDRGVDPERYAIWCRDAIIEMVEDGTVPNADWTEGSDLPKEVPAYRESQKLDENGQPMWRQGLRYDHFIALMEAANRKRFAAIEARLSALEAAIS